MLKFQWQPGLFAVPSLPIEPAAVGALTPFNSGSPGHRPHVRDPVLSHRGKVTSGDRMTGAERRRTVTVDVGRVQVGSARPGRRPVDDEHRHGGRPGHDRPGARARRGGQRARPGHGQQRRRRRAAVPEIVARGGRAGHRRLPLQRPPPPREVPGLRPGARQVPDQPRERRRQAPRRELRDDRPDRRRPRQAGPHRRQLGQPRPAPPDRDDGRQREARGAARRPRRDAGRDRGERDPLGRAGRGDRPRPRPDHPVGEGLRRAGPGRRLPAPGAALRPPAAPRPHRGGHGHEGHRGEHGRAVHPPPGRDRRHDPRVPDAAARAATGPRRSRSPSRSSSRSGSASSRRRSPPAPAAGGRRRPSSRRWRRRSRGTSRTEMPRWRERYRGRRGAAGSRSWAAS